VVVTGSAGAVAEGPKRRIPMVMFSVCVETVFLDLPIEDRIRRIRQAGYTAVEFWHPEGTWDGTTLRRDMPKSAPALRRACEDAGVTLNDFAFHAWDGSIGGSTVKPQDRDIYLDQVRRMLTFARAAGCGKGITLSGKVDPALSRLEMRRSMEEALGAATVLAAKEGVVLLLEPLNSLVDHPGYYLDGTAEAFEVIRAIGSPNLKLLYDVYHMQVMEGNLLHTIETNIDRIGHFHAAGVPGRAELFGTEVNYPEIIRRLEKLGYTGCFGLEYFPAMQDHDESLRKNLAYLLGE
jgi:hydroxypyruvate isomerase